MNKRTRKPAEERKAEIVDVAIRLAGDLGPDRLTTQHLAEEIGISQPAIFRHFATKGDIWMAVARRIATLMTPKDMQKTLAGVAPQDRLLRMMVNHLEYVSKTPAIPAILFSTELHAENQELRLFFAEMMANRHRRFSGIVLEEISAGRFRADLNADNAAYLILALVQGLAMRWSLSGREVDLAAEGEKLVELQLRAFR